MKLAPTHQPQSLEALYGPLPDEGRPSKLTFEQCVVVARKHVIGGASVGQLADIYGYSVGGMRAVLDGAFFKELCAKLWVEWTSGSQEAAAIADAAAPALMRRVVDFALRGDDDEHWERQQFVLNKTNPTLRAEAPPPPATPPADPVVINQLFVGLREFQQLSTQGGGPSQGLAARLLHGTQGLDQAELPATTEGLTGAALDTITPAVTVEGPAGAEPQ